jgi:hypothetical protein
MVLITDLSLTAAGLAAFDLQHLRIIASNYCMLSLVNAVRTSILEEFDIPTISRAGQTTKTVCACADREQKSAYRIMLHSVFLHTGVMMTIFSCVLKSNEVFTRF